MRDSVIILVNQMSLLVNVVKATMKMSNSHCAVNFLFIINCKFYQNGKQKVNTLNVIKCSKTLRHMAEKFVVKVTKNTFENNVILMQTTRLND